MFTVFRKLLKVLRHRYLYNVIWLFEDLRKIIDWTTVLKPFKIWLHTVNGVLWDTVKYIDEALQKLTQMIKKSKLTQN